MKSVVGDLTPPAAPLTPPSSKPSSSVPIPPLLLCSAVQPFNPIKVHNFPLKSQHPQQINLPRKFFLLAASSNNRSNDGDAKNDPSSKDEEGGIEEDGSKNNGNSIDGNAGGSGGNGNGRPRLNLKWVDMLLDPDPENIVAVGLTGVLAWASVQVLWQLFVISVAIVLAALKYSFVAALLIFILITLL